MKFFKVQKGIIYIAAILFIGTFFAIPQAKADQGTIQGYKIDENGQPFNNPGAALLIPGPGWVPASHTVGVSTNPYSISVSYSATGYAMLTSVPTGYTAYYSACVNCTAHPSSSYIKGSAASPLIPPAGGFIDLWWKYVPTVAGPTTQIIDSLAGGFYYAYAPTIVRQNGIYHMFFCSYGDPSKGVDYIRYANSVDGQHWSIPVVKVRSTAYQNMKDLAACDPSMVYYQGYYYLFYSSALYYPTPTNGRTVIQVARSQTIDGQYLTYTDRDTWEDTPMDPKVIIYPQVKDAGGYGAGQQQVVVRNNKLYMWYTDDSFGFPNQIYMLESTDPVQWFPSASRITNIPGGAHSPDIKFDLASNRFVMTKIINFHTANSFLAVGTSLDGLNWSPFTTLLPESSFPNFANNNGMAGDELGNLVSGPVLIAFAAPAETDRTLDLWGYWDLYGVIFDSTVLTTSTTPPPVQIGTIQGYKVKMPGNDTTAAPPSGETVMLDGATPLTANPYAFTNIPASNHTISVSVPSGWSVGYTLCYNSTACHTNTPISGSSVTVNIPAGGYADLWWHFTPTPSPSPSPSTSPSPPPLTNITTWINPNCYTALDLRNAADCKTVFDNPALWSNLLDKIDVYQFFIGAVEDNQGEIIGKAVPVLKQHNVAISVEAGGTLQYAGCDNNNGANSAVIELVKVKRIYDSGGTLTYLALDGPLARVMDPATCNFTLTQATTQLVNYLKTFHQSRPDVKIGLIVNFPNWGYGATTSYWGPDNTKGDYQQALAAVISAVNAAGEKLYFLHVDSPYEYITATQPTPFTGAKQIDWMQRILDLQAQVRSYGLDFGLIYNSGTGASVSDQDFYNDTLAYIDAYKSRGGKEQHHIIESWYSRPAKILKEDEPYSFTYLVSSALAKLNQYPIGNLDSVASSGLANGWALDPDTPAQTIDVHFYIDGNVPQYFAGATNASLARSDVNQTTGFPGDHGFNFYIPSQFKDGKNHVLYAYGIDSKEGVNPSLGGSPKSFTLAPPTDTTPPSVPANLTATAVSSSQINLSWSASIDNVGVAGYKIYRSGVQIGTSAISSFQNTGLSPSTGYSYAVSAFDAAGNNSSQSSSASATTQSPPLVSDTAPPSVPANLSALAISTSQINLSWNPSTDNVGVVGYKIYRAGSQIAISNATSFQNTGLAAATNHSYTVAAFDAAGNVSAQSATASATTQTATPPPDTTPPVISSVTSTVLSPTTTILAWITNEPADSQAEFGTSTAYSTSTTLENLLVTRHSLILNDLAPDTLYNFRVKSKDAAGNPALSGNNTFSTPSVSVPPAVDTASPTVPANLQATDARFNQITLSWNASTDAGSPVSIGVAGYKIYRNGSLITIIAATIYTDRAVLPESGYAYSVSAVDGAGNASARSQVINVKTPAPVPAPPPNPAPTPTPSPAPTPPPFSTRLINDQGTYYVVKDSQRQGITNPGMLYSYGFEFKDAVQATAADLNLPSGNLLLPANGSLVKSSIDPTVYLISQGKKQGFASAEVFNSLSFKFSSVLTVTAPELEQLPQGEIVANAQIAHPDGFDINEDGTIYWLNNQTKHGYPSLEVYNSWNLDNDFSRVVPANAADRNLPVGEAAPLRAIK